MCNLCPRKCAADRCDMLGFCKMKKKIKIARCAAHFWEEPPISGDKGSGAIFFSGCNLRCVFCQNEKISSGGFGKEVTKQQLCEMILRLQSEGICNINLVTPTHFADEIVSVLDMVKPKLKIPVVYNCGGYESEKTLEMLNGYIDIYLPDFKYISSVAAKKYSCAEDYFEVAKKAVDIMIKQAGKPVFDENGIMKKGVIIRHLVLPGLYRDSIKILKYLKDTYGTDKFLLSLMSQFTPNESCKNIKELNRKITTFEYRKAADFAAECGFNGYFQERESSDKAYVPAFDLTGVGSRD